MRGLGSKYCSGKIAPMNTSAQTPTNTVLLIHGLWNVRAWLLPLAHRLQAHGFRPHLFGYSTVAAPLDVAIQRLIKQLRNRKEAINVVGHSLGGLIALDALRHVPDLPIKRLVCLGSPLKGSAVARRLAEQKWGACLLGQSRERLCAGITPWNNHVQVGMVAGNRARGLGRVLLRFDGPSDGTVALEETYLPCLSDHCIVNASHSGLVFSAQAMRQCVHFLHQGRFAR